MSPELPVLSVVDVVPGPVPSLPEVLVVGDVVDGPADSVPVPVPSVSVPETLELDPAALLDEVEPLAVAVWLSSAGAPQAKDPATRAVSRAEENDRTAPL